MGLQTWKDEYCNKDWKTKWTGLLPENLKKHRVSLDGGILYSMCWIKGAFEKRHYQLFKDYDFCTDAKENVAFIYFIKYNDPKPMLKYIQRKEIKYKKAGIIASLKVLVDFFIWLTLISTLILLIVIDFVI